jgi:hypothetical protein
MALQSSVNVTLAYGIESALGTPSIAAGQLLRRVSSTLSTTKDAFTSNEVRPDQQISDMRHGMRRVAGGFEGELSLQSYDDFLEALLRGTWASGLTASDTDFTSFTASAQSSTFIFSGGNPVTKGLRVGDVFRFTSGGGTNADTNFRIVAFGGTSNRTVTVHPAPATIGTAVTTFGLAVQGKKLVCGLTSRSFTIEQLQSEIDITERFTGCRINSGSFALPPNGLATVSWDIMGQDGAVLSQANAPFFASPTSAPATGIFAGVSGSLRLAGAERGVVTNVDFQITNNCSMQPVVGRNTAPEIFYGRIVVTGNVSAYLEDDSLIATFLDEDEVELLTQMDLPGTQPVDFMTFHFPRIKLQGVSKTIGPDGGVIATFPFQALLPTATDVDTSTVVIQRSNS